MYNAKLENSPGENLGQPGCGDDILNAMPKAQIQERKTDKLSFIKIKSIYS